MSERAPLVIIGAGLAGYNPAREWCKLDGEMSLLMITAGDGRSRSKPTLSTDFSKNKDVGGLVMTEPGVMAEQLNARTSTRTRVIGIDPGHQRIWIGEEEARYCDLVLAWGMEPIWMPAEGDTQDALYPISDLEDHARFRQAAVGKHRALLPGAGSIGCEFVNDLSSDDYQLNMVAPCEQVMPGLFYPAAAKAVQVGLEGLGVCFHLGLVLANLKKAGEGLEAHLSDGEVIPHDLVASAVGLRLRTEPAFAAGLAVNRGIVTDRSLRISHADIYALGDCAEADGLNLLYVMPLMACAHTLVRTPAGNPSQVAYGPMPVTVKILVCPLVMSPPSRGMDGQWLVEGSGTDPKVLCRDTTGRVIGYALTGAAVNEELALNKESSDLMARVPLVPVIIPSRLVAKLSDDTGAVLRSMPSPIASTAVQSLWFWWTAVPLSVAGKAAWAQKQQTVREATMCKLELTTAIVEKVDLIKEQASRVLNALLDEITGVLDRKDSATLVSFGTLLQHHCEARTGKNPQTGQPVKIRASNTVAFKPGKTLRDTVN